MGVKGTLIKAAELGHVTEVRCGMPKCFCPEELGGASYFSPRTKQWNDWEATFENVPLIAGRNVLTILADGLGLIKGDWQIGKGQEYEKKGIYGPVTLTLPGTCYQIDISRWRFHGDIPTTPLFEGKATPNTTSPLRWHRTTFSLDRPIDSASPLLVRLEGMGKGILWLNGHNLGRYWQIGPQRDYYLPEPWLNVGENELILLETEGNTPQQVSLQWDENAASVVRIALAG